MKNNTRILPEKVTKPIQLLAAWLSGLIIVDGIYLFAAIQINSPSWASGLLVIASIINVPLFLLSIFMLQTKFRPEMQEDSYYSKYLEQKYTLGERSASKTDIETLNKKLAEEIIREIGPTAGSKKQRVVELLQTSEIHRIAYSEGHRRVLSELFLNPQEWPTLVDAYRNDPVFLEDIDVLEQNGLITYKKDDLKTCKLTLRGTQVAELAKKDNNLFEQRRHYPSFKSNL
ncbi:MAG: hypothetical protein KJ620_00690 [Candidatus Edwardsbacteria bacterium]|nr:hypothetical protein [Candidatus Edwardsbacteria bacterium]MBU1576146.1 hypothetical protein [Candidatus Edwardsbacteria bacterium]MBU2464222.1 hypothetical protein [Candidatus Edwardsbacteria bacterium]MBU2593186.1 hypothetical protein [Candidatus Edwardsbacteria bacterium]